MANTDLGTFVTQILLLTSISWGGASLLKVSNLLPTIISQFKNFGAVASLVTEGAGTLGEALKLAGNGTSILSGAFSSALPVILGISAAIAGLSVVLPKLSDWYKEVTNDVEYANSKLEENNSKLQENQEKLDELYKTPYDQRSSEIQDEIYALEKENEELKKNIDYWNEKSKQGKIEDLTSGYKKSGSSKKVISKEGNILDLQVSNEDEAIEKLKELNLVAEDFNGTLEEAGYLFVEIGNYISKEDYYQKLVDRQKELNNYFDSGGEITQELITEYQSIVNELEELREASSDFQATDLPTWLNEVNNQSATTENKLDDLSDNFYSAKESLELLTAGMSINSLQMKQLEKLYPQITELVKNNGDAYYVEKDALLDLSVAVGKWAEDNIEKQKEVTLNQLQATRDRLKLLIQEERALNGWSSSYYKYLMSLYTDIMGMEDDIKAGVYDYKYEEDDDGNNDQTGTTGGTDQNDPIKNQSEKFKEQNEILEHNIFLKQKQGATEQELIALYKNYQNNLHSQAEWFRSQGLDENSAYIRDLQEQWWNVTDTIKDSQEQILDNQRESFVERLEISENYIEERNNLNDWGADSEIKAWKRVLDWMDEWYSQGIIDYEYYLEKRKEAYENYIEAYKEELEKEKDLYETLFSTVSSKAQEEIEILQQKREDIQDSYQEQIDDLEKVNEELDEQIEKEEALDALNKARQTKVLVYKDGRFQYVQDIDQVSEAQENLDKINREQQLKEEVENLEELRDKELQSIDDQIEYWEKYKEEWSSVVDDYNKKQDELLLEQELGIKLEGENWQERLKNLEEYVNEYKALMNELLDLQDEPPKEETITSPKPGTVTSGTNIGATIGTIIGGGSIGIIGGAIGGIIGNVVGGVLDKVNSSSSSSSSSNSYSGTSTSGKGSYTIGSEKGKNFVDNAPAGSTMTGGDGSKWTKNPDGSTTISKGGDTWTVSGYASGTLSAPGGLSLVGENGPELRWINPGDGILPANITKNLWGWGSMSPNEFMSKPSGTSVVIQNLNLPNVRDPQDFTNYLKNNFWRKTIQFQTK